MQNIAKAGKGYALPFSRPAASFMLQVVDGVFRQQYSYTPLYAVIQSSGFSSLKNLST